jgi:diguanylate cyclase
MRMSEQSGNQGNPLPETGRRGPAEPISTEEFVAELISPVSARLAAETPRQVEEDRRLRRDLDEFLQEIETGLTDHVAGRAKQDLLPKLHAWFDRVDARQAAQRAEFSEMLQVLGKGLKAMQGGDIIFLDVLDGHLDRMRDASSGVQVRTVSKRLESLIDATVAHATQEREARDRQISSLSESIRGLHQELDEVRVQMAEDPLTGLFNRGSFDDRLEAELNKARLAPYNFSLIMIDLDHFKAINDTHLHVGGDRVLIACAQAIQRVVLRKSDLCARYGGEEMAVLLTDCAFKDAARVAENIREAIEGVVLTLETGVANPTASLGVTSFVEGDRAETVIKRADMALYRAKRSGRNQVQVAPQHERPKRSRSSLRQRSRKS